MSEEEKEGKASKFFKKVKEGGKDFVEGVKEELEVAQITAEEKAKDFKAEKSTSIRTSFESRMADTSTPEELYYSTWTWFWMMIFSIFVCLTVFLFCLTDPRFVLVGFLVLLAMPFIVIWCLIHMVPTIKIFGFTIFDRRQLSLRRQLSVGKEIARFFSREFLQESPIIAFFIFAFMVMFLFAILIALTG
ncbi:MAG: hypothetical protein JSV04_02445 [Candidatus Heimdallarchaeota archaeon]|nr:MAG: hypothetical protein JSV04_02445 [Candidatus Heimdallarchaeota archaeon]